MKRIIINNATIVNEGRKFIGSVIVNGERIEKIVEGTHTPEGSYDTIINAEGSYLLPGVIDEHVHFRDPGLTQKADILSESKAAAAGGVTSVMDMPNTMPQTVDIESLQQKQKLFDEKCLVNYACFFGATNDNYHLFPLLNKHEVCGIKLFMGSSTGNMLVDRQESLNKIFNGTDMLIMAHCEDSETIRINTNKYQEIYDGNAQIEAHALIRSAEACYKSSELAVQLAKAAGARLHIAHISTAQELQLLDDTSLKNKKITGEACIAHLMFCDSDYTTLGARIKCNPAVKTQADRDALRKAIRSNIIDTIATDHAPHLESDKQGGALKAASGMPMVQFSLPCMLELVDANILSIETVVQKMCHNPAILFKIRERGFIREGYKADLTLVKPNSPWIVKKNIINSKCGWSPLEGHTFSWSVKHTFVNGHMVYANGLLNEDTKGQRLYFN